MTKLLERAFAEAAKLPEEVQDRIAAHLLEELADDAKWDASFAALDRTGRTEELGFDEI